MWIFIDWPLVALVICTVLLLGGFALLAFQNARLYSDNQVLKKRLAQYEVPSNGTSHDVAERLPQVE